MNLRILKWGFVGVWLLQSAIAAVGYVEVKCDPGAKVFLDDNFKGVTNVEEGGKIIEAIPGSRVIKVVREGFQPIEKTVTVKANGVKQIKIDQFIPKIKIIQKGGDAERASRKTGFLVIETVPVECEIRIESLGVKTQKKRERVTMTAIPSGRHKAIVHGLGKTTRFEIEIPEGGEVQYFVNLLKNEAKKVKVVDVVARKAQAVERKLFKAVVGTPVCIQYVKSSKKERQEVIDAINATGMNVVLVRKASDGVYRPAGWAKSIHAQLEQARPAANALALLPILKDYQIKEYPPESKYPKSQRDYLLSQSYKVHINMP